jgi:hypothetical protein
MVLFTLLLLAATITFFVYLKNKQVDKGRHKRERYQEKQEELIALLRKGKNKNNERENVQE